jgi:hypothetical protein
MTPTPSSSSSDGQSLPPRHRPSLGNLTKDTTELDLWAFEDDLELGETPEKPAPDQPSRPSGGDIPAPRKRHVAKVREPASPLEGGSPAGGDQIQMNINKGRQRSQPNVPPVGLSKPEIEFDDLEHWQDVPKGPQIEELPEAAPLQEPKEIASPEPMMPAGEPSAQATEEPAQPAAADAEEDEFSPANRGNAQLASLQPHLKLSKAERIGLISLLVLLLAGGLVTLVFSIKDLPTESERAKANDFPIEGTMVTIDSAASYWRAPITGGATPETVRRGTKLLPVLELKTSKADGAIRVLFRNEERTVVGDAVTRAVRGAGTLEIPATAGFDDLGMHAAYRTGGSKPWTIEVFEAASENAVGSDFKRLFEMNISTDRR